MRRAKISRKKQSANAKGSKTQSAKSRAKRTIRSTNKARVLLELPKVAKRNKALKATAANRKKVLTAFLIRASGKIRHRFKKSLMQKSRAFSAHFG